jgi:predicted TIM-barrel fold metal-dependent hydrolase
MLRGKVLFGSDFPVIQVDRWMKDFENLDIEPEVAPLIVKRNALRVLGIRQFMWVITGWMTGYGHF